MRNVLVTWIGKTDLRAQAESKVVGVGPIAQAVASRTFEEIVLLSDYSEDEVQSFVGWLGKQTPAKIQTILTKLSGPTNFGEIYQAARGACLKAQSEQSTTTALTFHLSPGTPAMAAVWIILAKTKFPAELIESSREAGVQTASIPFDISADFIPDLLREKDERLKKLSWG